jgi:hypothetical protein
MRASCNEQGRPLLVVNSLARIKACFEYDVRLPEIAFGVLFVVSQSVQRARLRVLPRRTYSQTPLEHHTLSTTNTGVSVGVGVN